MSAFRTALFTLVPGALVAALVVSSGVSVEMPSPDLLSSENVQVAALVQPSPEVAPEVKTWEMPRRDVRSFVRDLDKTENVLAAGEDGTSYATLSSRTVLSLPQAAGAPNDPRRSEQWGLDRLDADNARANGGNGSGQVVAVLDTGVDASHPDLAGVVLPGADFVVGATDGRTDDNGHGTHVAGIIAAVNNNAAGVAGLADGVRILPVKVLNANGEGPDSQVAKGVIWATDNGADIINMSLGSTENVAALGAAVSYARSKDVVVVAAMGNSALQGDPTIYPAAYPGVLAVTATSAGDQRAMFSSSGAHAGVAAPGVSILSTFPNGQYAYQSGTSMSAPFVAASAALVRQSHTGWSEAQVVERLKSSAQDIGDPGRDNLFGSGVVDPLSARTDGAPRTAPKNPGLPTLPTLPLPDLNPGGLPDISPSFPGLPQRQLPDLPEGTLPDLPKVTLPDQPEQTLPDLPEGSLPDQPGLPMRALERMVLGVNSSSATVAYGAPVTISGSLAGFGPSNADQKIEILVKPHGAADFTLASTSTTDAAGRVAFTATPMVGADYALRYAGTQDVPAVTSRALHVDVAQSFTLTGKRQGTQIVLSGKLTPPRAGAEVSLERLSGTRWLSVEKTTTRPDGSFTFTRQRSSQVDMYRVRTGGVDGLVGGHSGGVSVSP